MKAEFWSEFDGTNWFRINSSDGQYTIEVTSEKGKKAVGEVLIEDGKILASKTRGKINSAIIHHDDGNVETVKL